MCIEWEEYTSLSFFSGIFRNEIVVSRYHAKEAFNIYPKRPESPVLQPSSVSSVTS